MAGPIARLAGQERPQAESAVCPCHPPLPPLIKGGKSAQHKRRERAEGSSPGFSTRQSRGWERTKKACPVARWNADLGLARQATICRLGRGWGVEKSAPADWIRRPVAARFCCAALHEEFPPLDNRDFWGLVNRGNIAIIRS